MTTHADQLLGFWFGDAHLDPEARRRQFGIWFGKSDDTDRALRERFGPDVERALAGELDGWLGTPRGRLGLVLLLDQLTRNLFRGTPRAFAGDARALALSREAILTGIDAALQPLERAFLYMPLEHAEDLSAQEQAVECFAKLQAQAGDHLGEAAASMLDYARRHRDVIARFGRFPHRNAILGRESTPDELEYLAQPGAGF